MKRTIVALLCIVLAAASARAQVVPSAAGSKLSVTAGGTASASQPDYAGNGIAQTSPNRLYGIGAYVDVRVNRWVQLEAESHWMRFNQYSWGDPALVNGEDTYMAGPRLPIHHFGRATPYGKVMVGLGKGSFLDKPALTLAYGGGLDYRLSKRFTLRAFDFEYQQWRVDPTLRPYGGSVGLGYKIF